MANLFEKLFNRKSSVVQNDNKKTNVVLPRPKYDFVEQYTVIDPKRVLNGGYELFYGCNMIPVACEESKTSACGFNRAIMLPRNIIAGFLDALKQAPAETIDNPKMRTISIVHLSDNQRVVIGPRIDKPGTVIVWTVDSKKHDWLFDITPEKNRAIVEAMKIHTR